MYLCTLRKRPKLANKKENKKNWQNGANLYGMFGATLKVNANWEHEKEIFFQCIMAKPEIATLLELQVVLSQN